MDDWRHHLRDAMDRHRWSVARLARDCGFSEDTMRNWLRSAGDRGEPNISDAIKIAEVTGLTLDELFRAIVSEDRVDRLVRETIERLREELQAETGGEEPDTRSKARPRRRRA